MLLHSPEMTINSVTTALLLDRNDARVLINESHPFNVLCGRSRHPFNQLLRSSLHFSLFHTLPLAVGSKTAILSLPPVCGWNMNLCFKDKRAALLTQSLFCSFSLWFLQQQSLTSHLRGKIPRLFEKVCLCVKLREREREKKKKKATDWEKMLKTEGSVFIWGRKKKTMDEEHF